MSTTLTSGCRTIWEKAAQVHHTPSTKARSTGMHSKGTHKCTTRPAGRRAARECTARARTAPSTHSKGTRSRHTQCGLAAVGHRHIGPGYNLCHPPLARCRRGPARPAECARSRSPSTLLRSRPSRAHAHTTTGCCGVPRPSNPRRVCAGRPQGRTRDAAVPRHAPLSAHTAKHREHVRGAGHPAHAPARPLASAGCRGPKPHIGDPCSKASLFPAAAPPARARARSCPMRGGCIGPAPAAHGRRRPPRPPLAPGPRARRVPLPFPSSSTARRLPVPGPVATA